MNPEKNYDVIVKNTKILIFMISKHAFNKGLLSKFIPSFHFYT
ncbi:hypothetical protein bthur0013_56870 [Bacillus thuringiensis IBL 200]|nr:hypothetical protein bthur0013_56870 [Bacillus thuringiensis IBL 200]